MHMLKELQGTPTAEFIYYCFHVLGFIAIFIFNIWYGKKRDISPKKSVITTIIVYGLTYIWIYIQFWIESGFRNFGGNNIVRGFVYIPVIAWPVAKLLKLSWKQICDFMAPCVCLCHGVSHMGCIFAGCCEGFPSTWGVYNARYGYLPHKVADSGGCNHCQYAQCHTRHYHPSADWCDSGYVDGERYYPHADLLRTEDSAPLDIPACIVYHLCGNLAPDRLVVDNHCDHWRGVDGRR
jgi:hypothetical protein